MCCQKFALRSWRAAVALFVTLAVIGGARPPTLAQSATPAASPATAESAAWPTYRGGAARDGVAPGPGPADSPAVRWRVQTQGQIHSEPAIVDGVVYIGSGDKMLHALDAATGAERWRATTGGAVAASPTVADGTVYVGSDDKILYALDAATGKERWRVAGAHADVSPAAADGVVYAGSDDGHLWALDAATGKQRWSASLGAEARPTPAVADGVVYLGSEDAVLHAIDAATGQERWRAAFDGGTLGTPVIRNGTVYEATFEGDHNRLAALDAATGKERWRFTTAAGDSVRPPVVTDDTVFVGSDNGHIYALDAATGKERWQFAARDSVDASPTLADGVLYAVSHDRTLYALDAATGTERWRLPIDGEADKGPAIAGGMAFLGTYAGSVYAVGSGQAATGGAAATPMATPAAAAGPVAFLWQSKGGSAGLQNPTDLAVDPQGRLWVTNGGAGQFQIFAPDGTFVETWGSPGSGDGQFDFVRENGDAYGGIEFAPDGSFYVLDTGNKRVQQFDANRKFIRAWTGTGATDGAFRDPMGMARANDGTVLVLDDVRGEVDRFSADGKFLGAFSSHPTSEGGLNSANDLRVDAQGNVYISALEPSKANFRVEKLDASGRLIATIGAADFTDQAVALAVDAAGRLYVTSESEVLVFGPDGRLLTRWGSFGSGPGQFTGPGGIVLDGQGDVYVADFDGGRIQKFALLPPLAITTTAMPAASPEPAAATPVANQSALEQIWQRSGGKDGDLYADGSVAIAPNGDIWVFDGGGEQFQIFSPAGDYLESWDGTGGGGAKFDFAYGDNSFDGDLAFDAQGHIYVVETGAQRVQVFDANRKLLTSWGGFGSGDGKFVTPFGLALDRQGNVYISDNSRDDVQVFTPDGAFVRRFGGHGRGPGQIDGAGYLAVDGQGRIWVADDKNNRIDRFAADGTPLPAIGAPDQFDEPIDVAIDGAGHVYVADLMHGQVQALTPDGQTLATWSAGTTPAGAKNLPYAVAVDDAGALYVAGVGADQNAESSLTKFTMLPLE